MFAILPDGVEIRPMLNAPEELSVVQSNRLSDHRHPVFLSVTECFGKPREYARKSTRCLPGFIRVPEVDRPPGERSYIDQRMPNACTDRNLLIHKRNGVSCAPIGEQHRAYEAVRSPPNGVRKIYHPLRPALRPISWRYDMFYFLGA
jgi:hypothetical protein